MKGRCELCGQVEYSLTGMAGHIRREHPLVTPLQCDRCPLERLGRHLMQVHQRLHNYRESLQKQRTCRTCGAIFAKIGTMKRHHEAKHGPLHQCPVCGYACKHKSLLLSHMRTHSEERPFCCHHCGKRYKTKPTIKSHMASHLPQPHQFTCEKCGRTFYRAYQLQQHQRRHHQQKVMNLPCSVCDYKTNDLNCLRSHMLTHKQERNFSCERCGRAYKSKGALNKHMKRHDGPAFPCTLCGRSYATKGTLTRHIKRHQNKREFECNLCGFEFFQSEDLRVHQFKVHKILGFQCDMCDAKFRLKADMKQHRVDVHFNKQREGSETQTPR